MSHPSDPLDTEFGDVVPTLQSLRGDDAPLEVPPEAIWDRIDAEIRAEDDGAVVPIEKRRGSRFSRGYLVLAAAAVVAVVAVGGLLVFRDDDESNTTVVAQAELTTLDSGAVIGSAELVQTDDTLEIEFTMDDMDPGEGHLELWLLTPEATDPVSLGVVQAGTTTRVEVPANADPSTSPVVDVSVEQDDGDPTHSGNSVVRGTLA